MENKRDNDYMSEKDTNTEDIVVSTNDSIHSDTIDDLETIEVSDVPQKKSKKISVIIELLIYAIIIYACVYIIPTYVMQRTIVDGPSMENTLHDDESLLVDKIVYKLNGLKRFDIIVFYPYGREAEEYYVKRIIGLPGETIQIIGSDIYINDKILIEDYGKNPIDYQGIAAEPLTLGEDEFFVLGDNREVSKDSRYEEVGPVSRENIGGRSMLRVWPLNKFGLVD